jgi:hypothetical protein
VKRTARQAIVACLGLRDRVRCEQAQKEPKRTLSFVHHKLQRPARQCGLAGLADPNPPQRHPNRLRLKGQSRIMALDPGLGRWRAGPGRGNTITVCLCVLLPLSCQG